MTAVIRGVALLLLRAVRQPKVAVLLQPAKLHKPKCFQTMHSAGDNTYCSRPFFYLAS
jgi:hypothetical protein